ncbi:MAG: hypothetical protein AAGK97_03890 [Bacteroidota bacterium]
MTISTYFQDKWHTVSLSTSEYIALQTSGSVQLVDAYFDEQANDFVDTIWAIDGGMHGVMFIANHFGEVLWEGSMHDVELTGFQMIEMLDEMPLRA